MVYENILEAVGNTPLIRLHHMTGEEDAQIFVKFEAVNVGASIKTRTALGMIKAAEREGKITKETIIVEPTSGNQGIGLALIGAVGTLFYAQLPQTRINTGIAQNLKTIKRIYNHT